MLHILFYSSRSGFLTMAENPHDSGKPGHFQKNCRHFRKEKGTDNADSKKGPDRRSSDRKGMSAIATSEEELLLIIEESELHRVSDETTWVVDSRSIVPSDPRPEVLSILQSRRSRGCFGWGMKVHAGLSAT